MTPLQYLDHYQARFIACLSADFTSAQSAHNAPAMRAINNTLVSAYRIRLQYQLTPYMLQRK